MENRKAVKVDIASMIQEIEDNRRAIDALVSKNGDLYSSIKSAEYKELSRIPSQKVFKISDPVVGKYCDFESVKFKVRITSSEDILNHIKKWGEYSSVRVDNEDSNSNVYYWHSGYLFTVFSGGGYRLFGKSSFDKDPIKCSEESWEQFKNGIISSELESHYSLGKR